MDLSIEGGFSDSVLGAQGVFRALMDALSRPGIARPLPFDVTPPEPLSAELGAVALTLCDHDTPIWLDPVLAAAPGVADWLRFQCGAPIVADPGAAQFALVSDMALLPRLEAFGQGSDEYPDRSATLVLDAILPTRPLRLTGPGIKGELEVALPLPGGDFLAQWAENRDRFPRGIDLVIVGHGAVTGLPRTTRISEA